MTNFIPPPVLSELLPPLLAHIPVAFTSPQPPPSLFALVSPILRQRLRLLAPAPGSAPSVEETWLSLLTWSSAGGPKLSAHLATQDFTPHPASGELELGEVDSRGFQRLDEETIKVCAELPERGIEVVYVWIANDPDGEDDGWRIMDVHLRSDSGETEWYPSIGAADEAFCRRKSTKPSPLAFNPTTRSHSVREFLRPDDGDEDGNGEDDYWDMYDRTPARTPVAPQNEGAMSEEEYYSRYANTQPALGPGTSSVASSPEQHSRFPGPLTIQHLTSYSPISISSTPPTAMSSSFPIRKEDASEPVAFALRPTSAGSSSSSRKGSVEVEKLEATAKANTQAEIGVKQHISTCIKSLYRLSKTVGIGRDEFERILQTEIALLEMMDEDE